MTQPTTTAPLAGADLRYPVGRFRPAIDENTPEEAAVAVLGAARAAIADLPHAFAASLEGLDEQQLATPYRPGGWSLRQLAHHVADSHMNAYVRLRLALTEEWPTIKPYREERWAELADVRSVRIEASLALLVPLHARWTALLAALGPSEWKRGYVHPEDGAVTLARMTELYAWHGRHHTAHVLAWRAAQA